MGWVGVLVIGPPTLQDMIDQNPLGEGIPSCLQIARTRAFLMFLCRGTAVFLPFAKFIHMSCFEP